MSPSPTSILPSRTLSVRRTVRFHRRHVMDIVAVLSPFHQCYRRRHPKSQTDWFVSARPRSLNTRPAFWAPKPPYAHPSIPPPPFIHAGSSVDPTMRRSEEKSPRRCSKSSSSHLLIQLSALGQQINPYSPRPLPPISSPANEAPSPPLPEAI